MSFLSTLFKSKKPQSDTIKVLETSTFATAITGNKVQLVDVRTSNEYRVGHIKNAMNIDFFREGDFRKAFEKMDKEKPVYIYCRSGARSKKASNRLADMGFSEIYDLKGGYLRWG